MKHHGLANARTKVLLAGLFVVMLVFVGKLFYLQVLRHNYYTDMANELHVAKYVINPERGKIFARDGQGVVPLVLNESVYTLFADPAEVKDSDKVESLARRVAGANLVDGFESKLTNKKLRYVVMAKQISRQQAELIQKEDLAGVGLQASDRRVYPEGQLGAQVLGYVNADGKGQYGLEEYAQSRLQGTAGKLEAITDVRRIPLTIGNNDTRVPAKNGDDLVLTIDRNVQTKAEQILKAGLDDVKATKGSIVVLDPRNGKVKAMANYPTYNPAEYGKVTDYSAFQNAVVSYPYEVGSVVKSLTMAAGLDTGVVTPDETYRNTGSVKIDDRVIKNVLQNVNSSNTTMTQVLEYSLNTGAVYVLQQMGGGNVNKQARDTLYGYFHDRYMFGEYTGIEQSGESRGILISPDSEQGNNVRYANMTFGQGMDLTMIQAASAFGAAVNGGTYYRPHLIDGTLDEEGNIKEQKSQVVKSGVVSTTTSDQLRTMLQEARRRGPGGGKDPAGYVVGGKTGTSQIIDTKTGEYSDDNSIGTYLGFGGATTPEYVIMVKVQDAKISGYSGSVAALPIFSQMSNWMIDYSR